MIRRYGIRASVDIAFQAPTSRTCRLSQMGVGIRRQERQKNLAVTVRCLVKGVMNSESKTLSHVARCPRCGEPHRYTEVKFAVANDRGSWLVECNKCDSSFVIVVRNPEECDPGQCTIVKRFDDDEGPYDGDAPFAQDIATYSLDLNGDKPRFDYDHDPIYRCVRSGCELEQSSRSALSAAFAEIREQCWQAVNLFLARRMPEVEHVVVTIDVPCICSERHVANFYCHFRVDSSWQPSLEDMLLADVSGTDLADELSGIHTKSYLMSALDKLIVRWRLFCDQILIAAPFVGHQWKKKNERRAIWERMLAQLDTRRTIFLTRPASFGEYKAALLDSGLDHARLERFGLENQIVSAGTKKQDFHAKVYIGLGEQCEVLSGSANLVDGTSMENATFVTSTRARVDKRYVEPLKVTVAEPPPRARHYVRIRFIDGCWRSSVEEGAAPRLSN